MDEYYNIETLDGWFDFLKRDRWSKMKYAERDAYYKSLLKKGCMAILDGQAKDLDEFMRKSILDTGLYSKSWSKFQRVSPSTYKNIYDAQAELTEATNLIELAHRNKIQGQLRMKQLSSGTWKYVDRDYVFSIVNSLINKQNSANKQQAAMLPTGEISQWAFNNKATIAVAIGLLFALKELNQRKTFFNHYLNQS